eukprot:scaffold2656_cov117-Amphora_coffeaeformis.AAC.3
MKLSICIVPVVLLVFSAWFVKPAFAFAGVLRHSRAWMTKATATRLPTRRRTIRTSRGSTQHAVISQAQDLELTMKVIMKNIRRLPSKEYYYDDDDAAAKQEQHQRALLTTRLEYGQKARAKEAARLAERRQQSLLQARLWLDDWQKQQTVRQQQRVTEAKQRTLLAKRLELETSIARDRKQVTDPLEPTNLLVHTSGVAQRQQEAVQEASRLAEARQRALLTTRLQLLQQQQKQTQTSVSWEDIISTVFQNNVPALIRIACAYSESQKIRPQLVETASVLSLTGERLEIAMLVCEGESCVNVVVPVTLPQSCQACGSSQQELRICMLGNLQTLDQKAHVRIEQAERVEVRQEELQQMGRLDAELQAAPEFQQDLPTWWTTGDVELQRECDRLKAILNEDEFVNEIRLLAQKHLDHLPEWMSDSDTKTDNSTMVTRAAVALVGSSGLLLRAQVRDKDRRTAIVPSAVPFYQGKVALAEALRSAVLELVDSVAS